MAAFRRSLRAPSTDQGAAAICYLNYGASPQRALIREPLALGKALKGYTQTVLLAPTNLPSWADLGMADGRCPDHYEPPTRSNLFRNVVRLAAAGYWIDILLFAHGWHEQFGAFESLPHSEQRIRADDIESELETSETGLTHLPIRALWSSCSYGATLNASWRSVGAKVCAGPRLLNFYPSSWNGFVESWNHGDAAFGDAVTSATSQEIRAATQSFIATVDAPQQRAEQLWQGCPGGKSVLGDHPCARAYFVGRWLGDEEWQPGLSGKENMDYASHMVCVGERSLTKHTRPAWR
jgi:hypothetical protein